MASPSYITRNGVAVRNPYLQIADQHIAETEKLIARQREHLVWLAQRGKDTVRAQEILVTLETGLASFRAHRDRVFRLLGSLDPPMPEVVDTTAARA
jgi:hypothetical protein